MGALKRMKLTPQKLEGWGYRTVILVDRLAKYLIKCPYYNFNRLCMIHPSDTQTDGR